MSKARTLLALGALLSVTTTNALADSLPKDLSKAYTNLDAAMRRLDLKAFGALIDADFVLVGPDGKTMDRAGFLQMVQPMFAGSQSATSTLKIKNATVSGGYAEVVFDLQLHLKNKSSITKLHEIGSDFWVLRNGKWMLYKTVEDKFDIKE